MLLTVSDEQAKLLYHLRNPRCPSMSSGTPTLIKYHRIMSNRIFSFLLVEPV